jgi:hypothetical protein
MIAILLIGGVALFIAVGAGALLTPPADGFAADPYDGQWPCLAD